MAASARAVSITTSATRIDTIEGGNNRVIGLAVYNAGAASVYLGGSGVTTAQGFTLPVGATATLDVDTTDGLYGIAAGTVEVRVLEVGI